jgi:hypothetical protein
MNSAEILIHNSSTGTKGIYLDGYTDDSYNSSQAVVVASTQGIFMDPAVKLPSKEITFQDSKED